MMVHDSAEQEENIASQQAILHSEDLNDQSLCRYQEVSCIRCCLPHIGGDSHWDKTGRYLGPGLLPMAFANFNPRQDPRIVASQYEDSFPDVGRREMEKRFAARRALFLALYDRSQPGRSLPLYLEEAQRREGYRYRFPANAGPVSLYLGGSVPRRFQNGELPECHLLGFVDGSGRVGCLAHPLAETSGGYDGRRQVGFFHHTDCCDAIGCEASREFQALSGSALQVFAAAVHGMSWYEYSRHGTSVLVYYLRGYDHLLKRLDQRGLLAGMSLRQLVAFTNALYEAWPLRRAGRPLSPGRHDPPGDDPACLAPLEILLADLPLAERVLYLALDTCFLRDRFPAQLQQAREQLERHLAALPQARL